MQVCVVYGDDTVVGLDPLVCVAHPFLLLSLSLRAGSWVEVRGSGGEGEVKLAMKVYPQMWMEEAYVHVYSEVGRVLLSGKCLVIAVAGHTVQQMYTRLLHHTNFISITVSSMLPPPPLMSKATISAISHGQINPLPVDKVMVKPMRDGDRRGPFTPPMGSSSPFLSAALTALTARLAGSIAGGGGNGESGYGTIGEGTTFMLADASSYHEYSILRQIPPRKEAGGGGLYHGNTHYATIKEIITTTLLAGLPHSLISKGILLHGSTGVGKTHLVNHLVQDLLLWGSTPSVERKGRVTVLPFAIDCHNMTEAPSKHELSSSSKVLKELVETLSGAPTADSGIMCAIVTIDDVHLTASLNVQWKSWLTAAINTLLLHRCLIVGITNDANFHSIASHMGLDRQYEVPLPSQAERAVVLRSLAWGGRGRTAATSEVETVIAELALRTAGYTQSDLVRLIRHARLTHKVKQSLVGISPSPSSPFFTIANIEASLREIRPSNLSSFDVKVPSISWEAIGGMSLVKDRVLQLINWQWTKEAGMRRMGVKPTKGVLLSGPSGCGKTLLAEALSSKVAANFIAVKTPELFSKYLGDSEAAVRSLFSRARSAAPCLLFLDELDAIGAKRDMGDSEAGGGVQERVLSTLLNELDGVEDLGGVVIVAATNRLHSIDPALIRPGRIDQIIDVPLPSGEEREDIVSLFTKSMLLAGDVDRKEIAALTDGWSGAMLQLLCTEAGFASLRESDASFVVTKAHFSRAMQIVISG